MAIVDLRREKKGVRQIAAEIGRSPATVSRELRRNADPAGRYQPHAADRLAQERVRRPRDRRVVLDEELRTAVAELLGKRWSPEQVAHELRVRFPDQLDRQLCAESIYQAIYDSDIPVSRPAKRRRRRRRRQLHGQEGRGRLVGMTMITDRPVEVLRHRRPRQRAVLCDTGTYLEPLLRVIEAPRARGRPGRDTRLSAEQDGSPGRPAGRDLVHKPQ